MLSSLPPKPRGAILGLCCCCFSAWTLWGLFLERVIGFFTGQYSAVHFRLPIRIIVFLLMCNCFLYYSLTKFNYFQFNVFYVVTSSLKSHVNTMLVLQCSFKANIILKGHSQRTSHRPSLKHQCTFSQWISFWLIDCLKWLKWLVKSIYFKFNVWLQF